MVETKEQVTGKSLPGHLRSWSEGNIGIDQQSPDWRLMQQEKHPWCNHFLFHQECLKDPDYSPQGSLQLATSGVYHPSMPCVQSSTEKKLAVRTPGCCSWSLRKCP